MSRAAEKLIEADQEVRWMGGKVKILCPAREGVPAVGLCPCGSAVELDREVTPCPSCELEFTKEGRELPPKEGESDEG